MASLEFDLGRPFDGLPALQTTRILEEFEAPLLSEMRTDGWASDSVYLERWCLDAKHVVRSLIVRTSPRAIAEYLARKRTVMSLLTLPNDDIGFLVDRIGAYRSAVQLVQVSKLPERYLPHATARHDESLRPDWDETPESFIIDGRWDAKLLSDIERRYLTVFAFNYYLGPDGTDIPAKVNKYILDSGLNYARVFSALRHAVPENENAHSVGVAAASPGVLTIMSPAERAGMIRTALLAVGKSETRVHYNDVHEWTRLETGEAEKELPTNAEKQLRALCNALDVALEKLMPESPDPTQLLFAGKVVAAYYRQLRRLFSPADDVHYLVEIPWEKSRRRKRTKKVL